jgi:hypothetical protein
VARLLSIVGPYPPDTLSTALGIQPSHIDTDTEGADSEREDGEWEASPVYLDRRFTTSDCADGGYPHAELVRGAYSRRVAAARGIVDAHGRGKRVAGS